MAEQKENPEPQDKKKLKELRDLKPRKDAKGGARNHGHTDKRPPSREIDFMNWDWRPASRCVRRSAIIRGHQVPVSSLRISR